MDDNESFVTLFPRDLSANASGFFPCGRYPNSYETKDFSFPEGVSCEKCTLQLIWATDDQIYYDCSDITIMSDKIKLCMGKCKNGGACVNGKCVCPASYFGNYCDEKGIQLKS